MERRLGFSQAAKQIDMIGIVTQETTKPVLSQRDEGCPTESGLRNSDLHNLKNCSFIWIFLLANTAGRSYNRLPVVHHYWKKYRNPQNQ